MKEFKMSIIYVVETAAKIFGGFALGAASIVYIGKNVKQKKVKQPKMNIDEIVSTVESKHEDEKHEGRYHWEDNKQEK